MAATPRNLLNFVCPRAEFVRRLNDLIGPENRRTLVGTHIDSWEGGGQNWTAGMRAEFGADVENGL